MVSFATLHIMLAVSRIVVYSVISRPLIQQKAMTSAASSMSRPTAGPTPSGAIDFLMLLQKLKVNQGRLLSFLTKLS